MSVFFCLSVVLLQGCLSLWSTILSEQTLIEEDCFDSECDHMATMIQASISHNIPACDDFYSHSCNNWISHNRLEGRSIYDQYTNVKMEMYTKIKDLLADDEKIFPRPIVHQKAKNFYASCISNTAGTQAGLRELQNMINSNGGWPLLNVEETKGLEQKWQNTHADYSEIDDLPALFDIQVLPSRKHSPIHVITLSMPFFDMHDLGTAKTPKTPFSDASPTSAYNKLIYEIANVLNEKSNDISYDRNTSRVIRERIDSIIAFEEKLEKLNYARFEPHFFDYKSYSMITIKRLQHEWDKVLLDIPSDKAKNYKINWLRTIRAAFAKSTVSQTIDESEEIAVEPGHYIRVLARLLRRTKPATIVNYIHWNAIKNMMKYSGNRIEALIYEYNRAVYGTESEDPRWLQCVKDFPLIHLLSAKLGHTDRLRIQQKVVRKMLFNIESEFMSEIKYPIPTGFPWMRYIHKFAPYLNHWVGFPDWSRDALNASAFYDSLDVAPNNYFRNILRFNKFMKKKELDKLRVPVDRLTAEWPVDPTDFVAAYDDRTNTVVLPEGLLQHPYMGFYKVPAIQYGALGSIIGHEMAHSIDDEEHIFDGLGDVPKTWVRQATLLYKGLRECYQKEYEEYKIELATGETLPIDTNLTVREVIADNLGFRMAFRAFRDSERFDNLYLRLGHLPTNYTQEQIFFYSLAQSFCENPSDEYLTNIAASDEHLPSKIRINGALSRMEEFHKAFECKKGDRMRKEVSQCRFWGQTIDYTYVYVDFD